MEGEPPHNNARQRLMESIINLGTKAFNPEATDSIQSRAMAAAEAEFNDLIQRQVRPSGPPHSQV